ncbi:inorganic pyrophosphatase [Mycoplasmatota bacterium]|nr:inorganic pyrophosphatase [Mycoplasmatota bacterium]
MEWNKFDKDFWEVLDKLTKESEIEIDRPKGSHHPKYSQITYPVDYGFLKETSSMDGGGIDIWKGSLSNGKLDAVICTVDLLKRDSEIKLLIGCTEAEKELVYLFHNVSEYMKGIMIRRV